VTTTFLFSYHYLPRGLDCNLWSFGGNFSNVDSSEIITIGTLRLEGKVSLKNGTVIPLYKVYKAMV